MRAVSVPLDPALSRHPSLLDCFAACAREAGLTQVAAQIGMQVSHLSDACSGTPTRKVGLEELEAFVREMKDVRPIVWLVGRFLAEASEMQAAAREQLLAEFERLAPLFAAAKGGRP